MSWIRRRRRAQFLLTPEAMITLLSARSRDFGSTSIRLTMHAERDAHHTSAPTPSPRSCTGSQQPKALA